MEGGYFVRTYNRTPAGVGQAWAAPGVVAEAAACRQAQDRQVAEAVTRGGMDGVRCEAVVEP